MVNFKYWLGLKMADNPPPTTQKCSGCKMVRELSFFVGKNGKPTKTCSKCREKDANRDKREDVKQKRVERNSQNEYWKTSREKQKAENPEEYLKNKAEYMRNYRANKANASTGTSTSTAE